MKIINLFVFFIFASSSILLASAVDQKPPKKNAATLMKSLKQVKKKNLTDGITPDWSTNKEVPSISCYKCTSCGDRKKLGKALVTKCTGERYKGGAKEGYEFTDCLDYKFDPKIKKFMNVCLNPKRFKKMDKTTNITTESEYYTYFYKPFCTMTVNDKGVQARGCVTDFVDVNGEANTQKIAGKCDQVPMNDERLAKGYTCYCDYGLCNAASLQREIPIFLLLTAYLLLFQII